MTLRRKAIKRLKHLNLPISYRVLDDSGLSDARNVFDNKSVTETRYGIKRFNTTSLGGEILSVSFFKKSSGDKYILAKVGTDLYSVASSGASTVIKSGLSAGTKHRAITLNDRHIIAIEDDGIFSFDGTIFSPLGQAAPTTGTATIASGGTLTDANNFKVGLTFYSTTTGFETNVYESNQVTSANPNKQINVTAIPTSCANLTINKVRIYLKNVTSNTDYLFIDEIALGTSTYSITANATSSIVPPTKNAPPIAGGAKYVALFGKKIVYAGNSNFPNEVFFSEEYLPDAFNSTSSQVILQIPGHGPITGLATGIYDEAFLNPFLAIFKKTTTAIYSELNNIPVLMTIDDHIGCISGDTIKVRNGSIYFMSINGWNFISKGTLVKDQNGDVVNLGRGNIDDIFSKVGWINELNIPSASTFFSAYYSTNFQYMTFVSEGANADILKAYIYEEKIGGFRVFTFKTALTCACEGEDASDYQCIFIGDKTGILFTYSNRNSRHDENYLGEVQTIPAYLILPYFMPGDDSSFYNFRNLVIRALSSQNAIEVRAIPNFDSNYISFEYDFDSGVTGFTLDVSSLDVDSFGSESVAITARADLNLTGEVLSLGFYQDILDGNIGLISAQLDVNKNGAANE